MSVSGQQCWENRVIFNKSKKKILVYGKSVGQCEKSLGIVRNNIIACTLYFNAFSDSCGGAPT